MAIIKVAKGGKTLSQAIKYAGKEDLTVGKDISDRKEQAIQEMKITKELYNKLDGRQYKHYIQSFAVGEIDVLQAQKIGLQFAESNFKGYEVFIGTHTDKGHIHNHMIVNSVNFETGNKFNVKKDFLAELKNSNDEICKTHGLKIVEKKELSGEVRVYDQKKYQTLKKAFEGKQKSYIHETAKDIKRTISNSFNKNEFIKNMSALGYKINWTEERKHVTFTDKENNKVRLSNLEKTFTDKTFTKEGLENEFKRNLERRTELSRKQPSIADGIIGNYSRNENIKRADEVLHINSHGQTSNSEIDNRQRIIEDTGSNQDGSQQNINHERGSATETNFDIERAKQNLIEQQRRSAKDFGEFREQNQKQQSDDGRRAEKLKRDSQPSHDGSQHEIEERNIRNRKKNREIDFER